MLEVRYIKAIGEITGWCGDETQFGNLDRGRNEAIVILDVPLPTKPINALLYDGKHIMNNPDYVEILPRNLASEVDMIKVKLVKLGVIIKW